MGVASLRPRSTWWLPPPDAYVSSSLKNYLDFILGRFDGPLHPPARTRHRGPRSSAFRMPDGTSGIGPESRSIADNGACCTCGELVLVQVRRRRVQTIPAGARAELLLRPSSHP